MLGVRTSIRGLAALADLDPAEVRRRVGPFGAALFAGVLLVGFGPPACDRVILGDRILRGVWAGPIALSGLTRERATTTLEHQAKRLGERRVVLRVGAAMVEAKAADLGFAVDVAATVGAAHGAGRSGGVTGRTRWWWQRWASAEQVSLVGRLDATRVAALADRLDREVIERRPFGGGLAVADGEVMPVAPRVGAVVNRELLGAGLVAAFSDGAVTTVEIALREMAPPLTVAEVRAAAAAQRGLVASAVRLVDPNSNEQIEVSPQDLAAALAGRVEAAPRPQLVAYFRPEVIAEKLRTRFATLERPPRDARFETDNRDRVLIVPAEPGVRIDPVLVADALVLAARAPGRTGVLPLDRAAEPTRTAADLQALRVTRLVAEFATFHPCCRPRVDNIHRIADILDGTIIAPGQTFSVNAAVGPRTAKNGFVAAPTIEEGEMVDSLGGGISQFATTLFNAVFHGGYDIVERTPHSYYFSRYPMGHEATLSFPKPDLVFRNDTEAGMLLRCEYGKTFIRVKIFGDNGGRETQAKVSQRHDIKRPPVEYIANAAMKPEDEEIVEAGSIGWTVTVSRLLSFPDGTKKEETRKVIYNPRIRRVELHPCRIPEGEKGHTGEDCPVPEDEGDSDGEAPIPDSIPPDSPLDEGF